MKTRVFDVRGDDAALYETIRPWWQGRDMAVLPVGMLSPCGVLVEADELPVAAVWIYFTCNTGIAWVEFLVTNPACSAVQAAKGIKVLLGAVDEVAKALGYEVLFTMTEKGSLLRTLKRSGYIENHSGVTQLVKRL